MARAYSTNAVRRTSSRASADVADLRVGNAFDGIRGRAYVRALIGAMIESIGL